MALSTISQKLKSIFKPVRESLSQPKTVVRIDACVGSALSFLLQDLADTSDLHLIICPTHEDAQLLKSDLEQLGLTGVGVLPPSKSKPYDSEQMHDLVASVQRTEILEAIALKTLNWLIASSESIFDKLPSPTQLQQNSIQLHRNEVYPYDNLVDYLLTSGYTMVSFVENPGEFAKRGGLLDIFPFNLEYPVRIEFFGDQVDSIREFDLASQRSVRFLEQLRLSPDLNLSFDSLEPITAYMSDQTRLVLVQPESIMAELARLYQQASEHYDPNKHQQTPQSLYVDTAYFLKSVGAFNRLYVGGKLNSEETLQSVSLQTSPQPDFNGSIKLLKEHLQKLTAEGILTYILCDNEGQRDRFEELLGESNAQLQYVLSLDRLSKGFLAKQAKLAIYTDHQIFNRYFRAIPKTSRKGGISQKELRDLHIGDYVVHVDYGIGRFEGFKTIKVRDIPQESVVLRYAEDSLMYVNVASLHKLQKYSGKEGAEPPITKLGTGEWARKKAKTKSRLKDIARELIQLYAKRKSQPAFAFASDHPWQTELEASFMYEETPDQLAAIEAVKEDMEKSTAMDRLVCGDVGFGKTEVAVRAAFKAVMNQKQVAVLVPTTILADQHAKTFRQRMQDFPVCIEVISRFKTDQEIKEILKRLKEGAVDIIIGTHRLISKDVVFKDLGLLIVDEEQRFGVATKEKLKEWRYSVDVLTLTATPIPRTLQLSLMGARDLSVITTPPPNRQPVYTEIHSFDAFLIRDAILKECSRGGQVFFIHNRVQNIQEVAGMIQEIVPDIRIRFAHGQMSGTELEKIITDFYQHKFDVLISTNIVENGIDISNANTIIINRADRFGLSELHQLRGRVGRSNRKAFCYLITPPLQDLSTDARRRLQSLEEFSDLGSGIHIAMRDLDIRGAGDILGAEQSGFINDIGIELYTKILNEAVSELKETEFKDLFDEIPVTIALPETQIETDLNAYIPKYYIQDDVERLNIYRMIAGYQHIHEMDTIQEELTDRFGKLPLEAEQLLISAKIRILASILMVHKVTIRGGKMWLQLPDSNTDGDFYQGGYFKQLMDQLDQKAAERYSLAQKDKAVRIVVSDIHQLVDAIHFLTLLSPYKVHVKA